MLVIRRKQGESLGVYLDDAHTVRIEIIELSATRVVLGIDAPPEVRIARTELLEAAEQNRAAAEAAKNFAPANISSYLAKIQR
jgi:carbon storage regulator